jgi:hypothetical protein
MGRKKEGFREEQDFTNGVSKLFTALSLMKTGANAGEIIILGKLFVKDGKLGKVLSSRV